jgi:hypothetical protein
MTDPSEAALDDMELLKMIVDNAGHTLRQAHEEMEGELAIRVDLRPDEHSSDDRVGRVHVLEANPELDDGERKHINYEMAESSLRMVQETNEIDRDNVSQENL